MELTDRQFDIKGNNKPWAYLFHRSVDGKAMTITGRQDPEEPLQKGDILFYHEGKTKRQFLIDNVTTRKHKGVFDDPKKAENAFFEAVCQVITY